MPDMYGNIISSMHYNIYIYIHGQWFINHLYSTWDAPPSRRFGVIPYSEWPGMVDIIYCSQTDVVHAWDLQWIVQFNQIKPEVESNGYTITEHVQLPV